MPGATGQMLSSRQWTTWSGTGRVTWGLDFPVFGTSARPPGGGASEVPFGLEASVELEVERRRFSPDDVGLLSQLEAVKEHAPGVVCNPHDPDAQWSAKGQGKREEELDGL
jgi:hypothetical protein